MMDGAGPARYFIRHELAMPRLSNAQFRLISHTESTASKSRADYRDTIIRSAFLDEARYPAPRQLPASIINIIPRKLVFRIL